MNSETSAEISRLLGDLRYGYLPFTKTILSIGGLLKKGFECAAESRDSAAEVASLKCRVAELKVHKDVLEQYFFNHF